MKNIKKTLIVSISICSLVIISFVSSLIIIFADNTLSERSDLYKYDSELELDELCEKIKKEIYTDNISIPDCLALGKKIKKEGNDGISELFENNIGNPAFASLLLEIAQEYEMIVDSEIIKNILFDEKVSDDFRYNIILYCGYCGTEYSDELAELSYDERFGFDAIRELYNVDKRRAIEIADEFLTDVGDEYTNDVDKGLFIRSMQYREGCTEDELLEYCVLCYNLMKCNPDCVGIITDYLSEMHDYNATRFLLYSSNLSDIEKYCVVGNNKELVYARLNEKPTVETVDFISMALTYGCYPEFYESFLTYLNDNSDFFSLHKNLNYSIEQAKAALEKEIAECNGQ